MPEFKVGDKVVLDGVPGYLRVKDGAVGTVVRVSSDPVQPYTVNIGGKRWTFAVQELRRANSDI